MRQLVIAVCIIALAGPAFSQGPGGYIGLYSDAGGTCCVVYETVNALNYVYVVHSGAPGAVAASFRVQNNWTNAVVGPTTYGGTKIGDIFAGVSVVYDNFACQPLPFLVATMSFIPTTPTPTNESLLLIVPDYANGRTDIEMVDCASVVRVAGTGPLYINIDYIPLGCDGCFGLPTEETTWGRVKSLYR